MTAELQLMLERYTAEVEENHRAIMSLMDAAFSDDPEEAHRGSLALAEALGVPEEERLETIEDIDAFFM